MRKFNLTVSKYLDLRYFFSSLFLFRLGACVLPVALFVGSQVHLGVASSSAYLFILPAALFILGCLELLLLVSRPISRLAYFVSSLLLFLFSFVFEFLFRLCGATNDRMLASYIQVILDSNPLEAKEFLQSYLTFSHVLLIISAVAVCWILSRFFKKVSPWPPHKGRFIGALALFFIGVGLVLSFRENGLTPLSVIYKAVLAYRQDLVAFSAATHPPAQVTQSPAPPRPFGATRHTIIFSLSESLTRHNMQIYGYERETTPRLLGRIGELFVFRDIITTESTTLRSLRSLLGLNQNLIAKEDGSEENLLVLFKKAGYKIWWISNQPKWGFRNTWTTSVGMLADVKEFNSELTTIRESRNLYDENLIESMERALKDPAPDKIIILHGAGAHFHALNRYPPSFNFFQDSAPLPKTYSPKRVSELRHINYYDNAVRYVDFVTSKMIDVIKAYDQADKKSSTGSGENQVLFLFCPDHGEDVAYTSSAIHHGGSEFSPYINEVPLIVWMNDILKARIDIPKETMVHRPSTISDLKYALLDVADVKSTHVHSTRSIFSKLFESHPRFVNEIDVDQIYYKKPAYVEKSVIDKTPIRSSPSKVWLHRADSVEKLAHFFNEYPGFEIDVMFDEKEGVMDVRHPPVASIGLSLEELLSSVKHPSTKRYWIDFKNLNRRNQNAALSYLIRVADKLHLRDKLIVESKAPELLSKFYLAGLYTSYYLPRFREYPSRQKWIKAVRRRLSRSRVNAISMPHSTYKEIKTRFPNYDVLLWTPRNMPVLIEDPRVKVILKEIKSPYDR